jgi:hypothetical protein
LREAKDDAARKRAMERLEAALKKMREPEKPKTNTTASPQNQ